MPPSLRFFPLLNSQTEYTRSYILRTSGICKHYFICACETYRVVTMQKPIREPGRPVSSLSSQRTLRTHTSTFWPMVLIYSVEKPIVEANNMRAYGATVLDAPLAFLDELEVLPDLPDGVHSSDAVLTVPTERMSWDLLALNTTHELSNSSESHADDALVDEATTKIRKRRSQPDSNALRKHEIAHLESQVRELEGELDRLQQSSSPSAEPTLWEDIAKRQREVKQQAEVENMKLRELYEGQLKVARGLMRLLHNGQNDLSLQLGNVKRQRIIEAYESADEIFQSISASLAARPNTMDEWMHENGLAGRHDRYDDARVRCGPKNDFFLEVMLCRRLPFSFEATVEAVWNTFSADHIETNNGVYGAVERSDKHYLVQSKVGMKLRRLDAVTELYAVGRRSDETNRMVMTAESRSITSCASFQGKRECLDEVTYLVVERDSSRPQPSTLVRSCKRSWPQLAESDGEDVSRSKLELLADMLVDVCNGNCRAMFQQIENSLLLSSQATQ